MNDETYAACVMALRDYADELQDSDCGLDVVLYMRDAAQWLASPDGRAAIERQLGMVAELTGLEVWACEKCSRNPWDGLCWECRVARRMAGDRWAGSRLTVPR